MGCSQSHLLHVNMAATTVDLSRYGDFKGRDSYMRNSFHVGKGNGVTPTEVAQSFYGITSATDARYELARVTATEGGVDDKIGTVTIGVSDGFTLNDVLALSNEVFEITTTTLKVTASDVIASGNLNVGVIQKNDLAEGSRVQLVDDATDPSINFVLGDLYDTPSTPLLVTKDTVAVNGSLTIDGTDILTAVTDGNPWESTGTVVNIKADYDSVDVSGSNLVNVAQLNNSLTQISLSSDVPGVDFKLGDTGTVAAITGTSASFNVPTTVNDSLTVMGDLTVQGTTVTINTTTMTVEDINIDLANAATLPSQLDGGA